MNTTRLVLVVVCVLVVEDPGDGEAEVCAEEVDEDGVAGVDGAQLLPPDHLVPHEQHDLDQGHHDQLINKERLVDVLSQVMPS